MRDDQQLRAELFHRVAQASTDLEVCALLDRALQSKLEAACMCQLAGAVMRRCSYPGDKWAFWPQAAWKSVRIMLTMGDIDAIPAEESIIRGLMHVLRIHRRTEPIETIRLILALIDAAKRSPSEHSATCLTELAQCNDAMEDHLDVMLAAADAFAPEYKVKILAGLAFGCQFGSSTCRPGTWQRVIEAMVATPLPHGQHGSTLAHLVTDECYFALHENVARSLGAPEARSFVCESIQYLHLAPLEDQERLFLEAVTIAVAGVRQGEEGYAQLLANIVRNGKKRLTGTRHVRDEERYQSLIRADDIMHRAAVIIGDHVSALPESCRQMLRGRTRVRIL